MKHEFQGKIENNEMKVSNRAYLQEIIESLNGKQVRLTIEKVTSKRSIMQNAYYWAVVVPIARSGLEDQGWKLSKEQVHEFLLDRFAREEIPNEQTGEILFIKGRSSGMNKSTFSDYIADIQQWASEFLNMVIPDPNQEFEEVEIG